MQNMWEYIFRSSRMGQISRDDMLGPESIWQMIYAIREC